MRKKMIVNRMNDWFQIEDMELGVCNLAMNILNRLYTRQVQGLEYDRIKLAYEILHRKSAETVVAIDDALCILISRNLVLLEERKMGKRKIMITELGKSALEEYKELMKDET